MRRNARYKINYYKVIIKYKINCYKINHKPGGRLQLLSTKFLLSHRTLPPLSRYQIIP